MLVGDAQPPKVRTYLQLPHQPFRYKKKLTIPGFREHISAQME
jgi:hypothetical protein